MTHAAAIRRHLKALEAELRPLQELRSHAKTEGGRLTPFGKALLATAKQSHIKQAHMAKLLDITPGAVSQHYSK